MSKNEAGKWVLATIGCMAYVALFSYHVGKQNADRWHTAHYHDAAWDCTVADSRFGCLQWTRRDYVERVLKSKGAK